MRGPAAPTLTPCGLGQAGARGTWGPTGSFGLRGFSYQRSYWPVCPAVGRLLDGVILAETRALGTFPQGGRPFQVVFPQKWHLGVHFLRPYMLNHVSPAPPHGPWTLFQRNTSRPGIVRQHTGTYPVLALFCFFSCLEAGGRFSVLLESRTFPVMWHGCPCCQSLFPERCVPFNLGPSIFPEYGDISPRISSGAASPPSFHILCLLLRSWRPP